MSDSVECVVIGAGVVGLAIARSLARAGLDTLCLEKEASFGSATSSRNSEVIHAGIHYPPRSLKSMLCVAGKQRLYRYCEEKSLPHRRCGKLIVATAENELPALERIRDNARRCGVDDLRWLDRAGVSEREPGIVALAGLWSPSTGIIDSHALMLALLGDFENAGGVFAPGSRFLSARSAGAARAGPCFEVEVDSGGRSRLHSRYLVNAAGLHAHEVARRVKGLPGRLVPGIHYARGHYFSLQAPAAFRHLVYPVPGPSGLGIHLTIDLAGQVRFGPDVQWVQQIDYSVAPGLADAFSAAIRRYWPALPDHSLQPAYAGIRPKLQGPGKAGSKASADFLVQGPADHGLDGLVNLFGIESPGLTSCMALAAQVRRVLLG